MKSIAGILRKTGVYSLVFIAGALLAESVAVAQASSGGTFMVQPGGAPWSDRVGVWQLASVPASVAGNGPLPQQSCSDRSIAVPAGSASILIGVSQDDAQKFQAGFPQATATGDTLTISHPDGSDVITYAVYRLANPPAVIQSSGETFGAGLILLQVGEKGPGDKASKAGTP